MNIVLDEFSSKRRVRLERYRFAVLIAHLLQTLPNDVSGNCRGSWLILNITRGVAGAHEQALLQLTATNTPQPLFGLSRHASRVMHHTQLMKRLQKRRRHEVVRYEEC
jgi:hypothetical protein